MSGLTVRLTELRSFLLPISQVAGWPIFFILSSAISQQPAYFLALVLVLAADLFDSTPGNRSLLRDSLAGATTAVLALFLNDQDGLAIGVMVGVVAFLRLSQNLARPNR